MQQDLRSNLLKTPASECNGPAERSKVYLHPGELFASVDACAVTTILGSCVAVCLWDPVSRIGGINHFLLPEWNKTTQPSPRFGDVAMKALIDRLLALGAQRRRLEAKMFGGACVLQAFQERESHLGARNVGAAESFLSEHNIPVVGSDVGGPKGRKLIFHIDDGSAWVKQL